MVGIYVFDRFHCYRNYCTKGISIKSSANTWTYSAPFGLLSEEGIAPDMLSLVKYLFVQCTHTPVKN